MKPWEKYINSVLNGERLAGRLERLAVELAVKRMNDKRYYFDEDEAQWALDVIGTFRHTKGDYKGKLFSLLNWQKFLTAFIFGLKHKKSGYRVTRKLLLVIAKKGGKSEYAGALDVLLAFYDGEPSAECYIAANKRDQARFVFDSARVIVKQLQEPLPEWGVLPELQDVKIYNSHVNMELRSSEGSFIKAIAADPDSMDGVFPHGATIDELHAGTGTGMIDNLESGAVSRSQSLTKITTTRGFNYLGALWQMERQYESILDGSVEDDSVFPLIFSMDDDDDWQDEKNWEKANPGIGVTPTWDNLRVQYKNALAEGGHKLVSFKTKNLNIWEKAATAWISREKYMQVSTDFNEDELIGKTCYGGLDLAVVRDLTAWALLFPPEKEGEPVKMLVKFWHPEDGARKREQKDKVPYELWRQKGWITFCPGDTIDHDYIKDQILIDMQRFDLRHVYYDRYNTSQLMPSLITQGAPMEPFSQSFTNFNAPICALEKCILDGQFDHQNNPILAWNFSNVVLKMNAGGSVIFDKDKSRDRIDGAVAAAMSYASWMNAESSVYDERGILMI